MQKKDYYQIKAPETVDELKKTAVIYWPSELCEKEKRSSIIPLLLKTQESFISLLHLASREPYSWIKALELSADLYPNLFLKHLVVLSDMGGESLKRFATELPQHFRETDFHFIYKNKNFYHHLKSLFGGKKWSNKSLGLDGEGLVKRYELTQGIIDVSILLLFGSASTNDFIPEEIEAKCVVGSMLGNQEELAKFIRQRYIWVSRITGGATSNAMGYLAQNHIKEVLKKSLPDWDFSKTTIEGVSQNEGRTLTRFDIVAQSPDRVCWGIEVSFQFTTNSVVERKAKQAQDRQRILHENGHKIAYVIDGAGNFERRSFIQDIIDYSDCTVNFSKDNLKRLAETMRRGG